MKTKFYIFILIYVMSTVSNAMVIDKKTVYNPGVNICISSFGNIIQSQEIVHRYRPTYELNFIKRQIIDWIFDDNDAGFYLQEFDPNNFYWQFVETKQHFGIMLLIPSDKIDEKFYTELGGGLNIPGKNFYGLSLPAAQNGEMISIVVGKEDLKLLHFENWKFNNSVDEHQWMTRSNVTELLKNETEVELHALNRTEVQCKISGMDTLNFKIAYQISNQAIQFNFNQNKTDQKVGLTNLMVRNY